MNYGRKQKEKSQEEKIIKCVKTAIKKFNSEEIFLIENDLSERCICAKFAQYLEKAIKKKKEFKKEGYSVNVEYNRGADNKENEIKRLGGNKIVPDLIIHKKQF